MTHDMLLILRYYLLTICIVFSAHAAQKNITNLPKILFGDRDSKDRHARDHHFGETMLRLCRVTKNFSSQTAPICSIPDDAWGLIFQFFHGKWQQIRTPAWFVQDARSLAICSDNRLAMATDTVSGLAGRAFFGRDIYIYNLITGNRQILDRIKTWRDWWSKGEVTVLAGLADNMLAAATFDDPYNIEIWDTASGLLVRELSGNDSWVSAMTQGPNGTLICGSVHDVIKILNVQDGRCLATFRAYEYPTDEVELKEMHADVTKETDQLLFHNEFSCGTDLHRPILAWLPCRITTLTMQGEKRLITKGGTCGAIFKTWNIENLNKIKLLQSHKSKVQSWSDDLHVTQIATLSHGMRALGNKNGSITLVGNGIRDTLPAHFSDGNWCYKHKVISLAASSDGYMFASGSNYRGLKLYHWVPNFSSLTSASAVINSTSPSPLRHRTPFKSSSFLEDALDSGIPIASALRIKKDMLSYTRRVREEEYRIHDSIFNRTKSHGLVVQIPVSSTS